MRKALVLHIFLLLSAFVATAQKARFEFYTTADGLAGNNTTSVAQDELGFIWFINDGKIHRYDGRNFLAYSPPPELQHTREPMLGLASWQDSLLLVWSEHLAFLFDPKTGNWRGIRIKDGVTKDDVAPFWQRLGKSSIVINSIKRGIGEATLWTFGGNQLAPVRLPGHIATLRYPYYWCDIDASGHTYLAYHDTLYQLDQSGHETVTPMNSIGTDCYDLCFQLDEDGALILLANWHFYRLDKAKNRFVPHPANRFLRAGQNHLHRFILGKNGSIWACGQDRNLIYYNAEADTLYNYHDELKILLPNSNDFKGVFQDKTGIVWIDTRLGLLKVRPQTYPFDNFFSGRNQLNAYYSFRGFTGHKGGMLYGVFYDGIAGFDPAKKQAPRLYTFKNILNFFDLYAAGDHIWVNGGQLFDPVSGALRDVPGSFRENNVGDNGFFAKDRNGTLWWASHYFLYRLDSSENKFEWIKELELPEKVFNKTEALHSGTKSGKLLISFMGKLLQYDPKTKMLRSFDPTDWGLPVTRITVIEEERSGQLWLGTDAGLVHVNPANGAVRRYTVSDGLPNNFICGLLTEGDSCLWLSTNHGLSRFHIPTGVFINFFEEDGLSSNEFNRKSYYKTRDGRLVFGGMRGVNTFFPETVMRAYQNRSKGARLILTAFEYTDERRDTLLRKTQFPARPEIHLYHWDWSYTFEYALTDYDNPKEIFYSYKMEGYKDGWSAPSKFNFTRFNSLPAGEYTFRVRARDSQGRWRPDQLAVKVVVHPPWWATWWAYVLYSLIAGILLYLFRRYELNRQTLKTNLKIEKVEAEKLKELDHFKSRLYTNLTHEFRTPLTVILGMVQQIRNEPEKYLNEGTRLIETNGKNLLALINQLLDLSKLENKSFQLHLQHTDIVPYLRYVTESYQTFANSKNLSLRFFTTLEALEMDFDEEQIKLVLTNLISNALKFTPSGGAILVRTTVVDERLNVEVHDTGIGIAEKDLPYVFDRFYQVDGSYTRESEGTGIGLAHTMELVKIMGGEIGVESPVPGGNAGSVFTVRLPVTHKAPAKDLTANGRATQGFASALPDKQTDEASGSDLLRTPIHPALPQLLIIEDNPDVVIYLKSCLEGLYQLDVAYNGKIGIEKALENIPDLIVSDVMMPENDGYQVCDTLKNDERTSHIPIILLTAKADAASRITGLKRGADAYLSKPFDKEELLVRLEMLVERQKRMVAHFSKNLLHEPVPASGEAQTEEIIRVENAFLQKVHQIVAENYTDEDFALPQLCHIIGMSRSQLFRKMQAVSATSPSDYIRSYRLNQAKALLGTTSMNVSEVAWKVGFKDPGHFSKLFQEEFGFPPGATRK